MLSIAKTFGAAITRKFSISNITLKAPSIAVVLSGNGVFDGSEVHEAAAVMAGITRAGGEVHCYAPDIDQTDVANHSKGGEAMDEKRNCLVESARIARGNISKLADLEVPKVDAVIFPGGFGAAKSLSNFAGKGADMTVIPEVERVLKEFYAAKKPIGLCCIAPILAAKVLGDQGISLTLGKKVDDGSWPYNGSIDVAKELGANMVEKDVSEVLVDEENLIVTTPAYMYEGKFHQIQDGVGKMVSEVFKLIK